MAEHIVVDGSNIATEGRSMPSLKQLDEAVRAFTDDHRDALITVVVDATFGHRIDPGEVAEFDAAVANNELVAPPAGAVGRGDAFVLSIAHKVGATILSNDSYQEFHGEYPWLFDDGRLIGGKPVPHVGWVFVPRLPVRGPLSRKSVTDAKRKGRGTKSDKRVDKAVVRQASPEASQPMPVPTSPPPNAKLPDKSAEVVGAAPVAPAAVAGGAASNDLLPYLSFVERHPLGTAVAAVIDRYSSHGAYVTIDDVVGYLPLRLMSEPPPRSAREFVKLGETVSLVVESYAPQRRSIDLAVPHMATAKPPAARAKRVKKAAKKVAAAPVEELATTTPAATTAPTPDVPAVAPAKRTRRKKAAAATPDVPAVAEPGVAQGAPQRSGVAQTPAVEPAPLVEQEAEVVQAPRPVKRSRKKAAATPTPVDTAEVAVGAAVKVDAEVVAAPPARSRRKKAVPADPPVEATTQAEVESAPAPAPARRARRAPKAAAPG